MYVIVHMGKTKGCLKDQIVGMIHMVATGDETNKHYIEGGYRDSQKNDGL